MVRRVGFNYVSGARLEIGDLLTERVAAGGGTGHSLTTLLVFRQLSFCFLFLPSDIWIGLGFFLLSPGVALGPVSSSSLLRLFLWVGSFAAVSLLVVD